MKSLPTMLSLAICLVAGASCIKEDRTECPCWLILDMSEVDGDSFGSFELDVRTQDGFSHVESIGKEDYAPEHIVQVPRGAVQLNAYYGADFDPRRGFVVEKGAGFPPLWLYCAEYDTFRDVVRDTVRLRKSFCLMRIQMLSDGAPCPYSLGIDGDVCGYTLSGSPEDGDFMVYLNPDGEGRCSVRVPRQKDSSLGLSVVDSGDVLRRFALGEYIVASGFDWSRPDLEDVDVTIDFARTRITLRTTDWDTTFCYTVEI